MSDAISIISVILALTSVFISFYIYRASRVDTSYLDIDKQYSELLKIGLNNPELRDYSKTSVFYKFNESDVFYLKYNIYANMCWNLVETIYDRQRVKKGDFHISETWLPILLEENRLHYTWFKHNLRLFKADFQRFVTGELNDIEIFMGDISDLKSIYSRYHRDFAAAELKSYEHLEMLMVKHKYKLILARHKIFNEIMGYAFLYENDELKTLWLDYMAIANRYQNAGYGTLLFNKIAQLKEEKILGIFLETEIPDGSDATAKDRLRRIKFYERLGAKKLNINYKLPTEDGGLPMYLFFRPSPSVKMLPKQQIKESIAAAFDYIHSDVSKKDAVLKSFLTEIEDEYFK